MSFLVSHRSEVEMIYRNKNSRILCGFDDAAANSLYITKRNLVVVNVRCSLTYITNTKYSKQYNFEICLDGFSRCDLCCWLHLTFIKKQKGYWNQYNLMPTLNMRLLQVCIFEIFSKFSHFDYCWKTYWQHLIILL